MGADTRIGGKILTVKEIRSLTGLSQKAFAECYHIPRRTIENWESEVSKCPGYVVELLEFKVKSDFMCNENVITEAKKSE